MAPVAQDGGHQDRIVAAIGDLPLLHLPRHRQGGRIELHDPGQPLLHRAQELLLALHAGGSISILCVSLVEQDSVGFCFPWQLASCLGGGLRRIVFLGQSRFIIAVPFPPPRRMPISISRIRSAGGMSQQGSRFVTRLQDYGVCPNGIRVLRAIEPGDDQAQPVGLAGIDL
jgi:hypothetical protein